MMVVLAVQVSHTLQCPGLATQDCQATSLCQEKRFHRSSLPRCSCPVGYRVWERGDHRAEEFPEAGPVLLQGPQDLQVAHRSVEVHLEGLRGLHGDVGTLQDLLLRGVTRAHRVQEVVGLLLGLQGHQDLRGHHILQDHLQVVQHQVEQVGVTSSRNGCRRLRGRLEQARHCRSICGCFVLGL